MTRAALILAPAVSAWGKTRSRRLPEGRNPMSTERRYVSWRESRGAQLEHQHDEPGVEIVTEEAGRCCTHTKCPGGSLCCCTEEDRP